MKRLLVPPSHAREKPRPMKRSHRLVLPVVFSVFCLQGLWAQIVNIEDRRSSPADTNRLALQLDLALSLVQNTKAVLNLSSGARLDWQHPSGTLLLLPDFQFVKVDEQRFVNRGFLHLRHTWKSSRSFAPEVFFQVQFDEQVRIRQRELAGGGLRFGLLEDGQSPVFFGAAYMFEYNEIKDTALIYRDHRLSTYLSFRWQPSAQLAIAGTTYFQPLLKDPDDFRLSSQLSLLVHITSRLDFRASFALVQDSRLKRDAPGVPATTYSLKNGLRWTF